MTCKDKQENNGVCPHHNLQCGWPKCNEPEQEPVARSDAYYMIDRFLQNNLNSDSDYAEYSKALDSIYTTPPQRKPLTDEEINGIAKNYALNNPTTPLHFARAIEAKLKEKNTQQDTNCKYCTNGCAACDARKVTNVLP